MQNIDFGRHSEDYAVCRPGLPASFYHRIDAIAPLAESRSLDLATGPGTVALELAARGGSVVGIDISEELIATARRISQDRKLEDRVRFEVAGAEKTGLDANSFDLVTASQCWHWFDQAAAMTEVLRLLRPGGALAIVRYAYLAEHTPVVRDTEKLILQFNPTWTMAGESGISADQIDDVMRGGFEFVEQFCYHHNEQFSHARWRGRMRTSNGVGSGALSPSEVLQFDNALNRLLLRKYPDPMTVEHRLWCVVARKPS